MKKLIFFTIIIFIFIGCSWLSKEEISNYTSPTSIYSTKNLIFYKIYGSNKNYSKFKIKDNQNFLCVHKINSPISNNCLDFDIKGEKLPIGTKILISGNVVKTKVYGISIGGYSSLIYFEGFLKNNEKIWITNFNLFEIFEDNKKIDIKNKEAYKILKKHIYKF